MANPQKPTLGRSQRRCQSEPSIPSRTCQHHHRHDHDAEPLSQRQHQYQLNPPVPDSVTSPESVRQQSPTSPSFAQYIPGSDNAIVSHEDVDVDMFQRMDIDDDPVTIPSLHPSYQHYDMEHRSAFVDSDPCSIRPPLAAPTETFIEYASPPLPSSPFRGFSRCMNMNMNINTSFSLNGFGHWAAPSTSSTSNITSGNVLSNTPASGPWSLHTAGASSLAIQAALLRDLNQSHSLITPRLDGHQPVVVTTTTATSSQPQSPSSLLSLSTTPNNNFHSNLAIPARTSLFGQPVFGTTSQIPQPTPFTPHSAFSGAGFGHSSTFGSVSSTFPLSLPTVSLSPDPLSSFFGGGSGRPSSESTFATVVTAGPSFGFPSSAVAQSSPAFEYSSPNTLPFTILPSAPTTLPDVTAATTATTAVTNGQEAITTASAEVVVPSEIPTTTAPSSPALVFFGPVFVTELYNTPPSTPPAVEGFFDLQQLPPAPHFASLYSNPGIPSPPIQQAVPVDHSDNVNNDDNSSSSNSNIINNTDPAPISNGTSTLALDNNNNITITPIDNNNSTSTSMSTHSTLSSDGTLPLHALRRVDLNRHEQRLQQRRRRRLALTRRRCIDETETGYNTDMDTELSSTDEDLCQRVIPRSRRHQPSYSTILSQYQSSSSGGGKSSRRERVLARQLERRERFLRFRSLFDESLDRRNQREIVTDEVDRPFDWFTMSDVPRRQARVPTPALFAASSGSRSTTTTSTPSLEQFIPISSFSSTSGPSAAASFKINPSLPASGITSSTTYQEWLVLVTNVDVNNIHSTEETLKFQDIQRLSSTLLQEMPRIFAGHDAGLDKKPLNKTTPRPASSSTSYCTSALSTSSSNTAQSRDAYGTSLLNNRPETPQSIEQQDPQNQTPNPNAESLFVFTMHTPPRRSARISGGASSSTSSNNPSPVAQPTVTPGTTTATMTTTLVSSIPSTATITPITTATRPTTRSTTRQRQTASTSTLDPIHSRQGTAASPQGHSLARRISRRLRRHLRFDPTIYIRYFFQNHTPRRVATYHSCSDRLLAGQPFQEPLVDNVDLNWRKDYYEKAPKSRICKQRKASMSIEVAEKEAHEKEHRLISRLQRIEDQNSRIEKRVRRDLLLNGLAVRRNEEEREKERKKELWMEQDDDMFGRFEKDRLEQERKRRAATSANRSMQGANQPPEASTNVDTLDTSADTPLLTTSSKSVPISSLSPQSIDRGLNSTPFQNLSVEDQFKQLIYITKQRVKAMEDVEEEEPLIRRSSRQRIRSERTRTVSTSSHTPVNSLSAIVEEQDRPSDNNSHTVMSSPTTVFSATDKGKGKKVHDNHGEVNIPYERSLVDGWHKALQEQRVQHDTAFARTLQEAEDCVAKNSSSSPFADGEALARQFQEAEDLEAILSSSPSSSLSSGDEALARELQKQEEEDQAAEEKMKSVALVDREQLFNDEALARRLQHEEVDDDELRREIKAKRRVLLDDASSTSLLSLPSPSFSSDAKSYSLPAQQTSASDERVSPPPAQSSGASPSLTPSSTRSSSPPSRSSRSSQSSRVPHLPYSRPSSSPPSLISSTGVHSSPPPPPPLSSPSPPAAQPPSTMGDHSNAHNTNQHEHSGSDPNFAGEDTTTTLSTANTTGTIAYAKRTRKVSSSVQVKRHSLRVQERKDFKKHYMSLEERG